MEGKLQDITTYIKWSSDQHTLHKRTPTSHILNNLSNFLFNDVNTNMHIFGGDFFDDIVDAPNLDMVRVQWWIRKYFKKCIEKNINIIRVLEGTFSHDRGQNEIFKILAPNDIDFKYITSITYEYIESRGISFLYIPDNLGYLGKENYHQKVFDLAVAELAKNNVKKVDFILMHSMFDVQAPPHLAHKFHSLVLWETLVNYAILGAHVHKPIQTGKLFTSGSFDRLAYGEEHPKGGLDIVFNSKQKLCKIDFYHNKYALPYTSIKINKETTQNELLTKVNAVLTKGYFPDNSYFKIVNGLKNVVNPIVNLLTREYPQYIFDKENYSEENIVINEDLYQDEIYQGITINKENITEILMEYINNNHFPNNSLNDPDLQIEDLKQLLSSFL